MRTVWLAWATVDPDENYTKSELLETLLDGPTPVAFESRDAAMAYVQIICDKRSVESWGIGEHPDFPHQIGPDPTWPGTYIGFGPPEGARTLYRSEPMPGPKPPPCKLVWTGDPTSRLSTVIPCMGGWCPEGWIVAEAGSP